MDKHKDCFLYPTTDVLLKLLLLNYQAVSYLWIQLNMLLFNFQVLAT